MGNCQSTNEEKKVSNKIDAELMREAKTKDEKNIKILLLGAGESGKSTIVKQMKIINLGGYSDAEKSKFKNIIYLNIYTSVKAFNDAIKKLDLVFRDPDNQKIMDSFMSDCEKWKSKGDFEYTQQTGINLSLLWKDPVVEEAMARSSEFYLPDSTP